MRPKRLLQTSAQPAAAGRGDSTPRSGAPPTPAHTALLPADTCMAHGPSSIMLTYYQVVVPLTAMYLLTL